jgi:hypothetical protein
MICPRCDGLTRRPHKNQTACMRAIWSDVRTLETKLVAQEANDASLFRAILTWSGTITRPQTDGAAPAAKAVAKPRPERTRVLRDPSPCIVRGPDAAVAAI